MALEGELRKTLDGFEGFVASEIIDVDLVVKPNRSTERHETSPDFIVYTKSPRNRLIEVGGVWYRISRADNEYLSMSIKIDGRVYNANAFPKKGESGVLSLQEWIV